MTDGATIGVANGDEPLELPPDRPRRERKVVETIRFSNGTPLPARRPSPAEAVELMAEPAEGREYFYDRIVNLRAPKRAEQPSIEVYIVRGGGVRLADALWDAGYRRHPDLEVERWIPSAGMVGRVSEYDEGVYVRRNEDGTWPSLRATDYIDPDDITIVEDKDEDGKRYFRATHVPSGRSADGKSRVKAQRTLLAELDELEDETESDEAE